ncbi:uncharacterized protein LOC119670405 [Teleopsis dalmanni]|uniref:uncharacterized protein LOC119670395 n=1 Tax=Teleopsis dalmanni TaxID=139649 RepID=UPI0018CF8E69|nr:uncharacterized protein LOC119670395 [Teleopsis dalmanni]XP_037936579.1 uncharacterized protein LOC119670405 [Teleopsis dalmanni]
MSHECETCTPQDFLLENLSKGDEKELLEILEKLETIKPIETFKPVQQHEIIIVEDEPKINSNHIECQEIILLEEKSGENLIKGQHCETIIIESESTENSIQVEDNDTIFSIDDSLSPERARANTEARNFNIWPFFIKSKDCVCNIWQNYIVNPIVYIICDDSDDSDESEETDDELC